VETEKSAAEHRALIKNSRLHPDNELPHDFLILWEKWRPPARTRSKRYRNILFRGIEGISDYNRKTVDYLDQ